MIYKVAFTGRRANAIGVFYPIFAEVDAPNHDEFIDRFYKQYERGPDGNTYRYEVHIERQDTDSESDYNEALYRIAN
jgi:hypothetical protein